MNRRSPGRKCCCHTEALHAGYQVILFTRMVLVPNYRIGLFSHGASRRVTVLLFRDLSFGPTDQREVICELDYFHTEHHGESRFFHTSFLFVPNYRICELVSSHGRSRMVTVLLSRDLSFGPTDQREVICELSNFFSHGESRRVSGFMSRIIELSNFFSHGRLRRFSLSRDMFLVTNLRISFFHTDCCGWLWRL